MALDQSGRGIGLLRPSSIGFGLGLNKFNVVSSRAKSNSLESSSVGPGSSFLKTILNIQGFNAPGPIESPVQSSVEPIAPSTPSPAVAANVQQPVASAEPVTATEPEPVPEPASTESTTIPAVDNDTPADLPTEPLVVEQETEIQEIETLTEDMTPSSPATFLTLTPTPAPAPAPLVVNDTKILIVDPTWTDESLNAPVTAEKIVALPEKAIGSTIIVRVEEISVSPVSEDEDPLVSVSEDVPAPVAQEVVPEPLSDVNPAPAVAPVEKVLSVDPTWTDASLDAPVDAATILALPLGSVPQVEETAAPAEEAVAPVEEPAAPVDLSEPTATPVEIEEPAQEKDIVAEDASITIEPATPITLVRTDLTVDPRFTDDSFNAPVTPETILALPNGVTVIEIPATEEKETAAPVPEPDVVPAVEPEVAATLEEPEVTPASPVIESTPVVLPVTLPVIKSLAVDASWTDENLEAPVTPEKLLALPDKVLSAPVSVSSSLAVQASLVPSGAFPRLTPDEVVIKTAIPVINAHGSSVAIALEHIEDVSALDTPVTLSSSSSFSPATTTATEEECPSSATSVADLEITIKAPKKVVRIIEPIVWPVILEDDFDAAVSSVLPADFELDEVMDLDLSWTIPSIKQSDRDAKEVAAEKSAVKALVRGNLQGRRLADAADRLELVVKSE
ncbi:hypothetical protein QBC43DRAFT_118448 [Cladorrhinum sp. PSN259]|nr:hypothetical protein QBC43DRAFT_118448 [Cladorrhinum sp. PSN259]